MSNTTQEVLTVDAINQYGIKYNGKNYSISTRLAQAGVTPQNFQVGSRIRAEVWTGPQGGKKINSYQVEGQQQVSVPAFSQPVLFTPPVLPPMPPALPVTSVAATQAPGGAPPVAKTRSTVPVTAEDKMSKAEWAVRNSEIALQAIIKSSIESPSLGEHVTGKSTPEFFALQRQYIKENLETYRMACNGQL